MSLQAGVAAVGPAKGPAPVSTPVSVFFRSFVQFAEFISLAVLAAGCWVKP